MIIEQLLNQTATWAAFTGTDSRDDYLYAPSVGIPARVVQKTKTVINKEGETITANWQIVTIQQVNLNDTINGNVVVGVTEMVDVRGNTVGYTSVTQ